MNLTVKFEDEMFRVAGSINADTATQFKAQIADAFGRESVTLDFQDVDTISSAGLRVIMALTRSGSRVKIVNVSRTVCDTLEITGFDTFVQVERPVKEVSVEGLPCIGTGATGSVYRLDDERVVKLFHERIGKDRVAAELATAREAFVLGVPTCIPFSMVRDGSRYGIVYELVNSSTLDELFAHADETEEDRLVRSYVDLLRGASAVDYTKSSRGMDIKKAMLGAAVRLKDVFFTESEYRLAVKLFQHMKEEHTFVHGDAHSGNVMLQDGELIYIDMTTSGFGDPFWDLVAIANYCYINALTCTDEVFRQKYVMSRERALDVFHKVFAEYYRGESADRIARLEDLAIGTAALRALLGELYNPNRNPVAISRLRALALNTAAILANTEAAELAA